MSRQVPPLMRIGVGADGDRLLLLRCVVTVDVQV
jgi:hypothetical protein